jgi:fucose 4-O-acetylase-like acetyltransferase
MPLFLGIFGFLIKDYKFENNKYYYKKLRRLILPFFTGSVVYFMLSHVLYYHNLFTFDTLKSFLKILIIPSFAHPHLWYLYSTGIQFCLLFALYKTHTLNARLKLEYFAFFLFFAIIINYTVPQDVIFEFKRTFGWFIFTLTGFLISNSFIPYYYNHLCVRSKAIIIALLSTIYLILNIIHIMFYNSTVDELLLSFLFVISNVLLIIIVLLVINNNKKVSIPIFNYLGINSLIIYLYHPLFRLFGIYVLNIKDTNYCLLIFLSIFICFPIVWLMNNSKIIRYLLTGVD